MNVGKAIRRDPTRTKMLRLSYQRKLSNLFRIFRKNCIPKLSILIDSYYQKFTFSREKKLLGLQDDADRIIDDEIFRNIHRPAPEVIDKYITQSYRRGSERAAEELEGYGIPVAKDLTFLDLEVLNDLKSRNFSLVRGATEDMKKEMLRIISDGVIAGRNPNDIARDLSKTVDKIGIRRARLIARTEIIKSYNTAVATKYKSSGVKKFRWLAAIDPRTCPECVRRDGRVFEWGEEMPPLHPDCRCTILAVVED